MANELQGSYAHGATVYALVRDKNANIWDTVSAALQVYNSAHYSGYAITATEQGASAYFTASMPAAAPAGYYNVLFKSQVGANPAESDPTTDAGNADWNGTNIYQVSDIAISGVISPTLMTRSWMVKNFNIYLKSSADHVTPFTSGVISGQISKDGGAFAALQSGSFTEIGHGFFALQALTSGDLTANTVGLLFTANGISGGSSDPLPMTIVLQRASGQ